MTTRPRSGCGAKSAPRGPTTTSVLAVADLVPHVEVLAEREAAVHHRDLGPGKRSPKRRTVCGVSEISGTSTIARLPSENGVVERGQVDLRLAAAGDPV